MTKKCVFLCVFNNHTYLQMCFLLLESIYIYGKIDEHIDILIYTSTEFMNRITQSHLYSENIRFEINDTYTNIDASCKARLDLFQLQSVSNYSQVLYLDTDVIIKNDLNPIFQLAEKDVLYVLEEGSIDDPTDFWGKALFGDEIDNYSDKVAFTSGIILFNNCTAVHDLFSNIRADMAQRSHFFHDQPFIVYNAFKYGMYDNQVLKSYAVNNDSNVYSDKTIHHFPGGLHVFESKREKMTNYLVSLKDATIQQHIDSAKEYINLYLLPFISNCGELLEGNIFMYHHTTTYTDLFLHKTKNISNIVLPSHIRNVMEIGFNSGFSALLMLLSNPHITLTCFDLGEHRYTYPCFLQLKKTFGNRIRLILGDSTLTIPKHEGIYDVIHIDGGHSTEVAQSDITHSLRLSRKGTVLIMDDYDFPNLHQLWDKSVDQYKLFPLDTYLYPSPHHDVKYVFTKP